MVILTFRKRMRMNGLKTQVKFLNIDHACISFSLSFVWWFSLLYILLLFFLFFGMFGISIVVVMYICYNNNSSSSSNRLVVGLSSLVGHSRLRGAKYHHGWMIFFAFYIHNFIVTHLWWPEKNIKSFRAFSSGFSSFFFGSRKEFLVFFFLSIYLYSQLTLRNFSSCSSDWNRSIFIFNWQFEIWKLVTTFFGEIKRERVM